MDKDATKEVKTMEEILTRVIKRRIEEEQEWACSTAVILDNNTNCVNDETKGFLNGVNYVCKTLREFIDSIEDVHLKEV